jgi:23S rRNA (cytidine1920-2'-O)/16S rRNA (cytidine1409-2'-O)-methyltransferase
VLTTVLEFAENIGYRMNGLTFSPIRGGEGNIEFLVHWRLGNTASSVPLEQNQLEQTVEEVLKQTKQWIETP